MTYKTKSIDKQNIKIYNKCVNVNRNRLKWGIWRINYEELYGL